jgi:hypothetical protein
MPKVYLDRGERTERIRYDSIEISGKFIQVYDDLHETLFQIGSACAIHLIFWMAHNMGSYNQVIMNKANRLEFSTSSMTNGGKRYSDDTIKSALRLLIKYQLVVSMSESGKREAMYFVNPYHFWKTGSQKERTESIKAYIYKLEQNEAN